MTEINNSNKEFVFKYRDITVCLLLVLVTFAVYWQVYGYDFVGLDDDRYVTENYLVQNGLTTEGILKAFTTFTLGLWTPLTSLSHMLIYDMYGLNPGGHHLANLLFHIANTLLLFFVLRRMTGNLWQCAFVAALFALHPLRVESVAWVTERKDVLSTFFWMLTIWGYLRYVKHPGIYRYLLVILFFILGLMAKPMLVTLPFVLLLLDYWPLYRFQYGHSGTLDKPRQWKLVFHLILEKIPFLVLSVITSVLTCIGVRKEGTVFTSVDVIPYVTRITDALVVYVKYIEKMIWPSKLAVYYPHHEMFSWWEITVACFLFVTMSFLSIRVMKRSPYVIVGWLWYVGTLVPVLGIARAEQQINLIADRFTYVPLIGLFIIIAWGANDLLSRWCYRRIILSIAGGIVISILIILTWKQVQYWENSITLFKHTLKHTSNNYRIHNNLGLALDKQGRTEEAIEHYLQALRIRPDDVDAHNNLGNAFIRKGNIKEAIVHFRKALSINPNNINARNNLNKVLMMQQKNK